VNESLTLLFDDDVEAFESHHYGFHVDDAEFDAVLQRLQANLPEFGAAGISGVRTSASLLREKTMDVSDAVDLLLISAVPERKSELGRLWGVGEGRVRLAGANHFNIGESFGVIQTTETSAPPPVLLGRACLRPRPPRTRVRNRKAGA
jgi:hypothetical protein